MPIARTLLPVAFLAAGWFSTAVAQPSVPTADGLYALVTVTDLGVDADPNGDSFYVELEYTLAPLNVANFVGLAEGTQDYIDYPAAAPSTGAPFYDGSRFHVVASGQFILGGLPTGLATDDGSPSTGPGYSLPDEFDPALRFDGPYKLAMVNNEPASSNVPSFGQSPNTIGSQFFLTLAANSNLNDVNTLIGEVVNDGVSRQVVDAIGAVPVDGGGAPLTPVLIQSVQIVAIGAGAQAFDPDSLALPEVAKEPVDIYLTDPELEPVLVYDAAMDRRHTFFVTEDLANWQSQRGFYLKNADPGREENAQQLVDLYAETGDRFFFKVVEVTYPGADSNVPASLSGQKLTLVGPSRTIELELTATPASEEPFLEATQTVNASATGPTEYLYQPRPYRATFFSLTDDPAFSATLTQFIEVTLIFETATSGTFKGGIANNAVTIGGALSGTFTLTPLP